MATTIKARTCPRCKRVIPLNSGFHFDEELNLICGFCGKVAFATRQDKEFERVYTTGNGTNGTSAPAKVYDWLYSHEGD